MTLSPIVAPVVPLKRSAEPPLTPAMSVDENLRESGNDVPPISVDAGSNDDEIKEPPKKKRRAALTHVSGIGS